MTTRLREWREQSGLDVEDIAERLGISPSYLYRLERGEKRLNEVLLRKLGKEFFVSADYLLGFKNDFSSRRIPLLGTIRAGLPILDQEPCGEVEISFSPSL